MTQSDIIRQRFNIADKLKGTRVTKNEVLFDRIRSKLNKGADVKSNLRINSNSPTNSREKAPRVVNNAKLGQNNKLRDFSSPEFSIVGADSSASMWLTVTETMDNSDMCTTEPDVIVGYPANVCLAANSTSYIISSANNQVYQTEYNGTLCDASRVVNVQNFPLGCYLGQQYSFGSEIAFPTGNGYGYTLQTFYAPGCNSNSIVAVNAYKNLVCFPADNQGINTEMYFNTTLFTFANSNCNMTIASDISETLLSKVCTAVPTTSLSSIYSFQATGYPEPVYVDGYLVVGYNGGETCSSVPQQIGGFALNVCQVDAMSQYASFKYVCDSDNYAYKYVYQSGDCDENTQTFIEKYDLGCSQSPLATSDSPVSVYAYCSEGSVVPVPGNAYYGLEKYFDADNCDGNALNYLGFPNNVCLPQGDVSYILQYPYFYEYTESTTCTGSSTIVDQLSSSTCMDMNMNMNNNNNNNNNRKALELEYYSSPAYYGDLAMGYFVQGDYVKGSSVISNSNSNGLSTAAEAGLALGLFILVAIVFGGLFACFVKNKRKALASDVEVVEK